MKKILILFTVLIYSQVGLPLEIDEKLTFRLLRSSSSKKTLLINRGLEDGLAKGDHAKIFDASGMVARGVIVKISPSRSVWSVYRILKPDEIKPNSILNLKVATPVKLTLDKSRMLATPNTPESSLVPLAPDAYDDPNVQLSLEDKKDLAQLEEAATIEPLVGVFVDRDWDIWGLFHFDGLSSSSDLATNGTATGANLNIRVSTGLEKYFSESTSWFKKVSVLGLLTYSMKQLAVLEGSQSDLSTVEFGLGLNYHFSISPNSFGQLIHYAGLNVGIGTSEETFTIQTSSQNSNPQTFQGSTNFFSVGYGVKYFQMSGIGYRMYIDYYRRGESFNIEGQNEPFTKVVAGPRFQVGLSYRW